MSRGPSEAHADASVAPAFSLPVRVYYEDTDAAGVVYYANYLRFLERARTEWLALLGHPVAELERAHGIVFVVRRIEVEANDERSTGDWAVFALANATDQQLDRLIVAPHFRLVGSGLIWPDLGANRIAAITPSEGFALDRQASESADVFLVTLNPGSVVTFIAELSSQKLPQVYLWEPEAIRE